MQSQLFEPGPSQYDLAAIRAKEGAIEERREKIEQQEHLSQTARHIAEDLLQSKRNVRVMCGNSDNFKYIYNGDNSDIVRSQVEAIVLTELEKRRVEKKQLEKQQESKNKATNDAILLIQPHLIRQDYIEARRMLHRTLDVRDSVYRSALTAVNEAEAHYKLHNHVSGVANGQG